MRYDKPPTIDPAAKSCEFIGPLTRDFVDTRESGNWHACIHPEGALYFHDPMRGVYTDSDLRNQDRRQKLESCVDELLALIPPGLGCNNRELVVQLAFNRKAGLSICRYYFIDHDKHLLFWLHPLSTVKLFCGVQGVEKPSHIKYAVEHQYWQHCEMYPNAKLQRTMLLKDLKEVVVHASAETITTDVSLSPFDGDELSKILDLISQLGEPESVGDAYTLCVVARFMRYFVRAKFFNFCGLPAARLDADQTVYKKKKKKKLIVVLSWAFNVAMFGAPKSHMQELRRVWVDRSINSPRWKNFNTRLSSEWSGITMYSTVMVAVDVSFLAVPSVSIQNSGSVTIISTYLSIFCIVGSLVVSLFLTRQNRLYGQESADTAVQFLTKMTGSAFGTKAVATVHGLPYAMLLWGMLYFMLAFSYQVFTSTPTLTLATTGSTCALVVLFTLWLVYAARDFHISTRFLGWLRASIWKAKQ